MPDESGLTSPDIPSETETFATPVGGDEKFLNYFLIVLFGLALIGLVYEAYNLFLKDCFLLWREKWRRTTTEAGFGSPRRTTGTGTNGI